MQVFLVFDSLRLINILFYTGLTLIGVLFDAFVCYFGRDLKLYEDDEEDSNKNALNPPPVNGKAEVEPVPERLEKA